MTNSLLNSKDREFFDVCLAFEVAATNNPEKLSKLKALRDYFEKTELFECLEDYLIQQKYNEFKESGLLGPFFPDDPEPSEQRNISAREFFECALSYYQSDVFVGHLQHTLNFDLEAHDRALAENPDFLANVPHNSEYYPVCTVGLTSSEVQEVRDLGFVVKSYVDVHSIISSRTDYNLE